MKSAKITVPEILGRKRRGPKLVVITAYDATIARLVEEAGVDIILVGDSLGMVVQGQETTLPVTLEDMCYHGRAVARASHRAHRVGDMPFMSYQISPEQALQSAGMLVQKGCYESVKLEGGLVCAEQVRRIVAAGIPVMGHVGLTPQKVHAMGGFRVQGKSPDQASRILEDAVAFEQAGAYSIVLEGIPQELARKITEAVSIPTIGIGAGPHCDGQVLVCYDLLGMFREVHPKFVKRFAELGDAVVAAVARYGEEVRSQVFPGPEHSFGPAAAPLPPPVPPENYGMGAVVEAAAPAYGPTQD